MQQKAKKLLKNSKKHQIFEFKYTYCVFINENDNKRIKK